LARAEADFASEEVGVAEKAQHRGHKERRGPRRNSKDGKRECLSMQNSMLLNLDVGFVFSVLSAFLVSSVLKICGACRGEGKIFIERFLSFQQISTGCIERIFPTYA
jgi:hypothetical protein